MPVLPQVQSVISSAQPSGIPQEDDAREPTITTGTFLLLIAAIRFVSKPPNIAPIDARSFWYGFLSKTGGCEQQEGEQLRQN